MRPFEDQLGSGATGLMRGLRRGIRKTVRTIVAAASRWSTWLPTAFGFLAVALVAPLLDRSLVRTWRESGFRGVRTKIALGLAVYLRLLVDRRTPLLGKGMLVFAIVYGVARRDLLPDVLLPLGVVDDLVVIGIASRCFTLLCPDQLVQEHAAKASRRRANSLRHQAG